MHKLHNNPIDEQHRRWGTLQQVTLKNTLIGIRKEALKLDVRPGTQYLLSVDVTYIFPRGRWCSGSTRNNSEEHLFASSQEWDTTPMSDGTNYSRDRGLSMHKVNAFIPLSTRCKISWTSKEILNHAKPWPTDVSVIFSIGSLKLGPFP